ncbi:hypothetical protein C2E20_7129 [Micractinium conductrix]|uniref:Apple domain-containing protein n=1 Tax=Micractinium conductrix TaxID=554055 RepID=A0A2P6V5T6_9CHLO|nr:hypothetical protein C2E20_7129 [Micractinium conductrix]|eukprot:PSC69437.1 hypothetical protein C2E20_7129 [Micractinium conductrix]
MGSDDSKALRRPSRSPILLAFLLSAVCGYLLFKLTLGASSGDVDTAGAGRKAAAGKTTQQQEASSTAAAAAAAAAAVPVPRWDVAEAQRVMEARACGSPAVDGYAHVKPECHQDSPAAQWYQQWQPTPDELDIWIERAADYDGLAVAWGIGNQKESIEECAEACRQHKPPGRGNPIDHLPCNAFAWCAHETCFEPDAHSHSKGNCWLKWTEGPAAPEVNMRGRLSTGAQQRHPAAPKEVQWHAGVLLPKGVVLRNGTWSPRHDW